MGAAAVVQGLAVQSSVGGIFARISPSVSYLVPLGLLALAMVGHAFRERSGGYAFSGGLLVELGSALAYVLFLHAEHRFFNVPNWPPGSSCRPSRLPCGRGVAVRPAMRPGWPAVVPTILG